MAKRAARAAVFALAAAAFALGCSAATRAEEIKEPPQACQASRFVPGELIVRLQGDMALEVFAATRGLGIKKKSPSGMHLLAVDVSGLDDVQAALRTFDTCVALNSDSQVAFAELNKLKTTGPPQPAKKSVSPDELPSACAASEFVPGELLLKLKPGNRLSKFALKNKLKVKKISPAGFALVSVNVWGMSKESALDATRAACISLNKDPAVEYAELNAIVHALKTGAPEKIK